MSLAWRILVTPKSTWEALRENPRWIEAVLFQWILLVASSVFAQRPLTDVFRSAGLAVSSESIRFPQLALSGIMMLAVVVSLNLLAAGLLKLATLPLGANLPFSKSLMCIAYSAIPVAAGALISALLFALIQPLSNNTAQIVALALKPYSFGAATFFPKFFPPATLSWFLASYLDVFSLWGLWLILAGARWAFDMRSRQLIWLALELMILSVAGIIGLWQLTQHSLLMFAK